MTTYDYGPVVLSGQHPETRQARPKTWLCAGGKVGCVAAKRLGFCVLLSVLSVDFAAAGGNGVAYKWIDQDGTVSYAQTPPSGQSAQRIDPPARVDTRMARKKLDSQIRRAARDQADRNAKHAEALALKEKAATRAANCSALRRELEGLLTHRRVYESATSGGRVRLPEEQRQSRIDQARTQIAELCQ